MADMNWCITPYGVDAHVLPSGTTVYSGTIPLTRDYDDPSVARSEKLSEITLTSGEKYAFYIFDPHHVFTKTISGSTIGPVDIGNIRLTIDVDSSGGQITVSNGVVVGKKKAQAPTSITIQIDLLDESGGGGGEAGRGISNTEINEDGELVITYNDGTSQNVGKVVGSDGKVYVPHMDEHHIITWTIEDEAGEIPSPVDLNPNDEWSGIDDSEITSDYVWEGI